MLIFCNYVYNIHAEKYVESMLSPYFAFAKSTLQITVMP